MKRLPAGCTEAPWGFIETTNGLVAKSTVAERNVRAELGEFAITLLGKLGVGEERLKALIVEADPVATLQKAQEGSQ